jgi:endoglucanase
MNWARLGDNFTTGPLVLHGLNQSDSYNTVRAKSDAIYGDMEALMGVNTIRLPINTHTVGSSWWNAYRGTIDAATDRGFKVILAYWEDGAASGGRITNMAAFNSMWSTVTNQYGSNNLVYFEPMNEPYGYSSSEWRNLAADWLDYHYSAPAHRVLISGTGFNQDLRDVCNDSRFNNSLLSMHHYAFFYGPMDYWGFRNDFEMLLGNCASRAVATEYGAPMSTGLDYSDPNSDENFVRYIRAITDSMHDLDIGGTYWPALGGKFTDDLGYDWYSMFALQGSGTNLSLAIRNPSGAQRILHGWGDTIGGGGGFEHLTSRHSSLCLDVASESTADGGNIQQWSCHGGDNQQWELQSVGSGYYQIVSRHSGLCLDVASWSTADGGNIQQWSCHGGNNQQWSRAPA